MKTARDIIEQVGRDAIKDAERQSGHAQQPQTEGGRVMRIWRKDGPRGHRLGRSGPTVVREASFVTALSLGRLTVPHRRVLLASDKTTLDGSVLKV